MSNEIITETEYKKTDTIAYLHSTSNHPRECIENIIILQKMRHFRNCSKVATAKLHIEFFKFKLRERNHCFITLCKKAKKVNKPRWKYLLYKNKSTQNKRVHFITTFNHLQPEFKRILRKPTNDLPLDYWEALGG